MMRLVEEEFSFVEESHLNLESNVVVRYVTAFEMFAILFRDPTKLLFSRCAWK